MATFKDRLRCWKFNLFPSYRSSGAWITHIAENWQEVSIRLPLNLWTRNYVGTTYCGSMYSAVAPWYMAMLAQTLGPEYLVWDKTVKISFQKPGQSALYAHFSLSDDHLAEIRAELEGKRSTERTYIVELVDAQKVVHAAFEEVVYIRRKRT